MHFSGDKPVFLTSVKSLRKLLTPCSVPALLFESLLCTTAAGAVVINKAMETAIGKSIIV